MAERAVRQRSGKITAGAVRRSFSAVEQKRALESLIHTILMLRLDI
ncbi:MAG: hypothetical protein KBG09_05700 [Syntrophobacterales bacterium]|nr:hypothetical protein [Syntrophobacterales bacterium]